MLSHARGVILLAAEGVPDSYEDAMAHFETVVGDVGPCSSFERRHAFLTAGPEMTSSTSSSDGAYSLQLGLEAPGSLRSSLCCMAVALARARQR